MNGTRRAELEEIKGCPIFMALTHSFWGSQVSEALG